MKKYIFILATALLLTSQQVLAKPQPIPGADIIIKKICSSSTSICNRSYAFVHTDENGEFSASGLFSEDLYDIYYGNESLPPIIKTKPVNGKIIGKIYVDIYDQAVPATKTEVKKEVIVPQKTVVSPVVKPELSTNSATFVYGNWDLAHLTKLKNVLVSEKVLSESVNILTLEDVRTSVKLFQKKYNIDQTGTLGPTTIKKLNSLVK